MQTLFERDKMQKLKSVLLQVCLNPKGTLLISSDFPSLISFRFKSVLFTILSTILAVHHKVRRGKKHLCTDIIFSESVITVIGLSFVWSVMGELSNIGYLNLIIGAPD